MHTSSKIGTHNVQIVKNDSYLTIHHNNTYKKHGSHGNVIKKLTLKKRYGGYVFKCVKNISEATFKLKYVVYWKNIRNLIHRFIYLKSKFILNVIRINF